MNKLKKRLADNCKLVTNTKIHLNKIRLITGVSINTKTLQPGDLFIPFRGENVNGHRFVQDAFEKGAAASLWLKDEPNPPKDVPLLFVDSAEKALQQMAEAYRAELICCFHRNYWIER